MIKILVPTDYSATADNAFLYALNLCKMYGGEILVMHSYKLDVYSIKGSAKATDEAELGRTLGAFDIFKEKVAAMRRLAEKNNLDQVTVKFILEQGELVQNIQEIVSKEVIDLVVMGTTGNSGFDNKIFGSLTSAVIKNASVPVLSIPHLCRFEGIDAVGFTTIYDEEDAALIHKFVPFAKEKSIDIYCIHVNKGKSDKNADEIAEWKAAFKSEPVFFIEKIGGKVVQSIFDTLEEHSIDVISCITRNKSFIDRLFESSVAEKLSYHKRIPLLTFHENMFK